MYAIRSYYDLDEKAVDPHRHGRPGQRRNELALTAGGATGTAGDGRRLAGEYPTMHKGEAVVIEVVITSYSIHYTKLYDMPLLVLRGEPPARLLGAGRTFPPRPEFAAAALGVGHVAAARDAVV